MINPPLQEQTAKADYIIIIRALVTATAKFFRKFSNKFGIMLTYSYLCKRK